MLLAARFILGASLYRTEFAASATSARTIEARDDDNWLVWVDVTESGNGPAFSKTPVPTPLLLGDACRAQAVAACRRSAVGGV